MVSVLIHQVRTHADADPNKQPTPRLPTRTLSSDPGSHEGRGPNPKKRYASCRQGRSPKANQAPQQEPTYRSTAGSHKPACHAVDSRAHAPCKRQLLFNAEGRQLSAVSSITRINPIPPLSLSGLRRPRRILPNTGNDTPVLVVLTATETPCLKSPTPAQRPKNKKGTIKPCLVHSILQSTAQNLSWGTKSSFIPLEKRVYTHHSLALGEETTTAMVLLFRPTHHPPHINSAPPHPRRHHLPLQCEANDSPTF